MTYDVSVPHSAVLECETCGFTVVCHIDNLLGGTHYCGECQNEMEAHT